MKSDNSQINENGEQVVNLDLLPKNPERVFSALKKGNMVVCRSGDDFLYISQTKSIFQMFSHTIGAPGGGKNEFPVNEKYKATIKQVVELADSIYLAEYTPGMNIIAVMATAEDAILAMFPGNDREKDEVIDFGV